MEAKYHIRKCEIDHTYWCNALEAKQTPWLLAPDLFLLYRSTLHLPIIVCKAIHCQIDSCSCCRQILHYDWQGRFHAEFRDHPMCHLLAIQIDQRVQGKDRRTFLRTSVGCGGLGKRREPERSVVRGGHRQFAGRPVTRSLPLRGPHLWDAGKIVFLIINVFSRFFIIQYIVHIRGCNH